MASAGGLKGSRPSRAGSSRSDPTSKICSLGKKEFREENKTRKWFILYIQTEGWEGECRLLGPERGAGSELGKQVTATHTHTDDSHDSSHGAHSDSG